MTYLPARPDLEQLRHQAKDLLREATRGEAPGPGRRVDRGFGLLYPPGGALSSEKDPVVPEPSRYSAPITVADARSEMDVLNHRSCTSSTSRGAAGRSCIYAATATMDLSK